MFICFVCFIIFEHPQEYILKISWRSDLIWLRSSKIRKLYWRDRGKKGRREGRGRERILLCNSLIIFNRYPCYTLISCLAFSEQSLIYCLWIYIQEEVLFFHINHSLRVVLRGRQFSMFCFLLFPFLNINSPICYLTPLHRMSFF